MNTYLIYSASGEVIQAASGAHPEVAALAFLLDASYILDDVPGSVGSKYVDVSGEAPSVAAKPPQPSPAHTWDAVAKAWGLPPHSMSDMVARKKAGIDATRDQARHSGVTFNGVLFDSDPVSAGTSPAGQLRLRPAYPSPRASWRSQDNRDIPFTSADILGLAAAMVAKTTACYQRAWQLKALVDQIADSADYARLESMDITAGWPI
jgi:hypothetical protein